MKLFFMLEGRRGSDVPGPILSEVFKLLSRWGFEINWAKPEEILSPCDLLKARYDLYLLRSNTELSLSIAGVLYTQGARLLNPYPSCVAIKDKIIASHILQAAGIQTPRSWVTGDLNLLFPIVEKIPLIVKPSRGFHGRDIHIVSTSKDLVNIASIEEPMLVQEYVKGTGEDLKIYVIGKGVFATRKAFSPSSFTRPGQPCTISKEVRNIALRCGEVFGLGLYGLDIIESSNGPVVVDVNYFPGYKGIPNAAALLADYIKRYALGDHSINLTTFEFTTPFRYIINVSSGRLHG